ncbi:hypothetical protein ACM66B_004453 [Microbotryomycetes sp. NB124-2]
MQPSLSSNVDAQDTTQLMWFSNTNDELTSASGGAGALASWLGATAGRNSTTTTRVGTTPNMLYDSDHHAAWTPSVFAHQPADLDVGDLKINAASAAAPFDYFTLDSFGTTGSSAQQPLLLRGQSPAGISQYALDDTPEFERQQPSLSTFAVADDDDVFASFGHRRKRAMSSPALLTPGGSLHHLQQYHNSSSTAFERGPFEMPLELKMMKKLRPGTGMTSSSSGSRTMSSAQSTTLSEESPASSTSTVLTPPDSNIPPPVIAVESFINPFVKTEEPDMSTTHAEPLVDTTFPVLTSTVSLTDLAGPAPPPLSLLPDDNGETLPSSAIPVMGLPASTQATYEMFHMPAMHNELVAAQAQPFMYELEARQHAGAQPYNVVLGPSSTQAASAGANLVQTDEAESQESDDGKDKTADRRLSLERNRLAAVKSRRKKKERVQNLESAARTQATKNQALQNIALSLRNELMQLRSRLDAHDGCDCEHVAGYLARERSGGGIPTIDALAGRVFSIDYKNVPTLGSEEDCYKDHYTPAPEIADLMRKAGKPGPGGGARVKKESNGLPTKNVAPVRAGARTRRLTATSGQDLTVAMPTLPVLPETSSSTHFGAAELIIRPSSAPPTTPSWEPAAISSGADSYFAVPAPTQA